MLEVMVRKEKREGRPMVPYTFPFAFKKYLLCEFHMYILRSSIISTPCPAFNPPGRFSVHTPTL